jgi:tripartite-type tricarboxylate transporter receptor subunit TctC
VLARAYAQKLSEIWGQSIVIENRVGAAQMIGTDAVAKSPADGYTFLVTDSSPLVINPHLYAKMPYDPVKDFAPVAVLGKLSPVIAINAELPATTLRDLVALAKAKPGQLSYGSFGSGNYSHIAMENFRQLAGIELVHVPYKGSPPALIDLVAGRVQIVLATLSVFEQQERAGKLRLIAAATPARLAARPELPTVAEAGLPGAETGSWFGLLAPAGVAPAIVAKVHADTMRVAAMPDFREQTFARLALEPVPVSPEQFRELLRSDHERWGRLVKSNGAKVE